MSQDQRPLVLLRSIAVAHPLLRHILAASRQIAVQSPAGQRTGAMLAPNSGARWTTSDNGHYRSSSVPTPRKASRSSPKVGGRSDLCLAWTMPPNGKRPGENRRECRSLAPHRPYQRRHPHARKLVTSCTQFRVGLTARETDRETIGNPQLSHDQRPLV